MPRYDCDEPEFAGCFIAFSDAWSLKEVNAVWNAPPGETVAAVRPKVTALQLARVGGEPISVAQELTNEALEEIDLRLYYWLTGCFVKVTGDLGRLGETLRRRLFASCAEPAEGAPQAV